MNNIFVPKKLNKSDGAVACYEVQTGRTETEMHWHSCAEIIHSRSGELTLFLEDRAARLSEGETVFLPPGTLHCCRATDPDACRVVIGMEEGLVLSLGAPESALLPFHSECFRESLIFSPTESFTSLFSEFLAFSEEKLGESTSEELCGIILVGRVYCEMLAVWESLSLINRTHKTSAVIAKIRNLIEKRFNEPLEAQAVASELNVSYSHMASLIRKELNTSFGDLLLKARVEASKRLLLTADMSITDIALEAGFTDSSYYIKKFRALTGTTPRKYRAENRERLNRRN